MARRGQERRQTRSMNTRAVLNWTRSADRLWVAPARGGVYWLVGDGMGRWTAQWRPSGGKVEYLAVGVAEAAGRNMAVRHLLEVQAGDLLAGAGGADLNRRDLRGAATTWKQRRF